jgi:hypothetical protein
VLQLEATADILEREAYVADESDVMVHPLVRATEEFLVKQLGLRGTGAGAAVQAHQKKEASRDSPAQPAGSRSVAGAATEDNCGQDARDVTLLISLSGGTGAPLPLLVMT